MGALAELVVDDRQPAGIADRLDLPGDPRRALALHVLAPERHHRLHQPARRLDLEVLALAPDGRAVRAEHLVARARAPVGLDPQAEGVALPQLGVGDRLPEPLARLLDVDLEHLLPESLHEVALPAD